MLNGGFCHSNSETLQQMGIELTAFFLYSSQQEKCQYLSLGHYTRDDSATLGLLANLFRIMRDSKTEFLFPRQQKLCIKLAFGIMNLHSKTDTLVEIFTRLFSKEEEIKESDMNKGILISSFIKPFIVARGDPNDQAGDQLLNFVLEFIYPKSLDVLAENAPHLLEMTQQLQASLNLYLLLKSRYKNNLQFRSANIPKLYFDKLHPALVSAQDTNDKDLKDAEKLQDEMAK